jgi:hypothetical protein
MKLKSEFTVTAPLKQTWNAPVDAGRIAGCLPGARLAPSGREGIYDGQMRVRLGAPTVASGCRCPSRPHRGGSTPGSGHRVAGPTPDTSPAPQAPRPAFVIRVRSGLRTRTFELRTGE